MTIEMGTRMVIYTGIQTGETTNSVAGCFLMLASTYCIAMMILSLSLLANLFILLYVAIIEKHQCYSTFSTNI